MSFFGFFILIATMCTSKVYSVWASICLILVAVCVLVNSILWGLIALDEYDATTQLLFFFGDEPRLDYAF